MDETELNAWLKAKKLKVGENKFLPIDPPQALAEATNGGGCLVMFSRLLAAPAEQTCNGQPDSQEPILSIQVSGMVGIVNFARGYKLPKGQKVLVRQRTD